MGSDAVSSLAAMWTARTAQSSSGMDSWGWPARDLGSPSWRSRPSSVSVLWALAPEQVADQVREGHDAAVAAALGFLQDHAAFTRQSGGGTVQEATGGYLAAVFMHRTSRAGDPQLRVAVVLAAEYLII